MHTDFTIQEINEEEKVIMEELLYEAVFVPPHTDKPSKDIIHVPEIYNYIKDFGKDRNDLCLIAKIGEKIAGGVWTRILSGKIKGFGNIDEFTPEFAIALFPQYRNLGIGTALMKAMIFLLKEKGYKQASLNVKKDNYAVKMYRSAGFKIVGEDSEDYLMLIDLK